MNKRRHNGDVIFDVDMGVCCRCHKPATIASLGFGGEFCTTDCLDSMWDEYFEACRRSDERYGDIS